MFRALKEGLRKPTPKTLIERELEEHQRLLLKAEGGQDFANAMVEYHTKSVARLKARVKGETTSNVIGMTGARP